MSASEDSLRQTIRSLSALRETYRTECVLLRETRKGASDSKMVLIDETIAMKERMLKALDRSIAVCSEQLETFQRFKR